MDVPVPHQHQAVAANDRFVFFNMPDFFEWVRVRQVRELVSAVELTQTIRDVLFQEHLCLVRSTTLTGFAALEEWWCVFKAHPKQSLRQEPFLNLAVNLSSFAVVQRHAPDLVEHRLRDSAEWVALKVQRVHLGNPLFRLRQAQVCWASLTKETALQIDATLQQCPVPSLRSCLLEVFEASMFERLSSLVGVVRILTNLLKVLKWCAELANVSQGVLWPLPFHEGTLRECLN